MSDNSAHEESSPKTRILLFARKKLNHWNRQVSERSPRLFVHEPV